MNDIKKTLVLFPSTWPFPIFIGISFLVFQERTVLSSASDAPPNFVQHSRDWLTMSSVSAPIINVVWQMDMWTGLHLPLTLCFSSHIHLHIMTALFCFSGSGVEEKAKGIYAMLSHQRAWSYRQLLLCESRLRKSSNLTHESIRPGGFILHFLGARKITWCSFCLSLCRFSWVFPKSWLSLFQIAWVSW